MNPETARKVNLAGLTGILLVLLGAYAFQFIKGELPCPLCLLQRCGMLGICFGFMLNIRFGNRPSHYGIAILSAVLGAAVSVRQILLHIVPGTGEYGSAILGLHLYTWAFFIFTAAIVIISIVMMFDAQFNSTKESQPIQLTGYAKIIFITAMVIAFANVVTTFLECGIAPCDDNPIKYKLLSLL